MRGAASRLLWPRLRARLSRGGPSRPKPRPKPHTEALYGHGHHAGRGPRRATSPSRMAAQALATAAHRAAVRGGVVDGSPAETVAALAAALAGGATYHSLRDVLRAALAGAAPSPSAHALACLALLSESRPAEAAAGALATAPTGGGGGGEAEESAGAPASAAAAAAPPAPASAAPVWHLLLEALACVEPWARPTASAGHAVVTAGAASQAQAQQQPACPASDRAAAASLLSSRLLPPPPHLDARCALRLAQTFQLGPSDLTGLHSHHTGGDAWCRADAYASSALASGSHTPAVLLALQLRLPGVARPHTLAPLLAAGHAGLAESLAASLGGPAPAVLVRACLDGGLYRAAHGAAVRFGLGGAFPEAARLHLAASLERLAARGAWAPALSLCGGDAAAGALLLRLAVAAGAREAARDAARRFGLPLGADALAAADEADEKVAAASLRLGLPAGAVAWVDSEAGLRAAADALRGAPCVGVDAEWAPDGGGPGGYGSGGGGGGGVGAGAAPRARVALLQLALPTAVFLLDFPLLAARHPAALQAALAGALLRGGGGGGGGGGDGGDGGDGATRQPPQPQPPLLLGVGVRDDLARCAAAAPGVPFFAAAAACGGGGGGGAWVVDLRDAWRALAQGPLQQAPPPQGPPQQGPPQPQPAAAAPGGLSSLCLALLGKPLDKRPRLSDWERRPLSPQQRDYAALDAHAALRVWDALARPWGSTGAARARVVAAAAQPPAAAAAAGRRAGQQPPAGAGAGAPAAPSDAPLGDGPGPDGGLGTAAVRRALAPLGLPYALHTTAEDGATCAAAARALGVPLRRVVKSIALVVAAGAPSPPAPPLPAPPPSLVLLLLHGGQRADLGRVARLLGVGRRALRLATAAECVALFGHAPGCMPPAGHRVAPGVVLMDEELLEEGGDVTLYAGGGARDAHLAMAAGDMLRAAGARAARVAAAGPPAGGDGGGGGGFGGGGGGDDDGDGDAAASPAEEGGGGPAAAAAAPEVTGGGGGAPPAPGGDPPAPAFAFDGALSRLGRWLRCLGVDAAAAGPGGVGPAAAAALAQAGRVLLTRSAALADALAGRGACAAFLVTHDDPRLQLEQVRLHFGLAFRRDAMLSRCAACNGRVRVRVTPADLDADAPRCRGVPAHVRAACAEFWACDACDKVYWVGPKSRRAVQLAVQLGAGTVFGHPLGRTGPAAGAAAAPGDGVVAAPVSELAAQVEAVLEELGFSYARPWSAAARAAAPP